LVKGLSADDADYTDSFLVVSEIGLLSAFGRFEREDIRR
jgi:hypothetical protein